LGLYFLTINEKAIVAPTVPAPTIATLAVVGLGILFCVLDWVWFGSRIRWDG
jgi:hypothetical protein